MASPWCPVAFVGVAAVATASEAPAIVVGAKKEALVRIAAAKKWRNLAARRASSAAACHLGREAGGKTVRTSLFNACRMISSPHAYCPTSDPLPERNVPVNRCGGIFEMWPGATGLPQSSRSTARVRPRPIITISGSKYLRQSARRHARVFACRFVSCHATSRVSACINEIGSLGV